MFLIIITLILIYKDNFKFKFLFFNNYNRKICYKQINYLNKH